MLHPRAIFGRLWPRSAPDAAASWHAALEDDLDFRHGHFGPTVWCASWQEWQERLRRDAPPRAFLVAERGGARRVLAEWERADLNALPPARGHFPRLKYYHARAGWTVAVCLALEGRAGAAD